MGIAFKELEGWFRHGSLAARFFSSDGGNWGEPGGVRLSRGRMLYEGGERRRPWERGTSMASAVHAAPLLGAPRRIVTAATAVGLVGLVAMAMPALSAVDFLFRVPERAAGRIELARAPLADERRPVALRGRVLDARGDPVPGARIEVMSNLSARATAIESDPRGEFVIEPGASPAAGIKIRAEGACHEHAESVELDAASAHDVVLVLPPMGAVAGRVTDARGAAVARAVAKLAGGPGESAAIAVASDDGEYAFRCIPAGPKRLTVWARAYATSTELLRVDGGDVSRDVRLSPAHAIRGTVVDPEGHPIALARVSACAGDDQEQAFSDAFGHFELPALTAGCSVRAHHPRFAGSRAVPIPLAADIKVPLEPGGAIEGVATDARGRPIASFTFALTSFEPVEGEPEESRAGESHDELRGTFRIDELVPGNYGIELRADGMTPWTSTVHVGAGKVSRGLHAVLVPDSAPDEPGVESVEGTSTPEISVSNIDSVGEEGEATLEVKGKD